MWLRALGLQERTFSMNSTNSFKFMLLFGRDKKTRASLDDGSRVHGVYWYRVIIPLN